MESQFLCPECGRTHAEPADARLGHRVVCLDCALLLDGVLLAIEARPIDTSIAA